MWLLLNELLIQNWWIYCNCTLLQPLMDVWSVLEPQSYFPEGGLSEQGFICCHWSYHKTLNITAQPT